MKYYGIRRKIQQEDRRYALQKAQARIKAKIPGKGKEYREEWYKEQYTNEGISHRRIGEIEDSSIPEGKDCGLYCIVTSDLIRREDITDFQKGIKKLPFLHFHYATFRQASRLHRHKTLSGSLEIKNASG